MRPQGPPRRVFAPHRGSRSNSRSRLLAPSARLVAGWASRATRSRQGRRDVSALRAADHEIGIPTAAGRAAQPACPIDYGCRLAIARNLISDVGLGTVAAAVERSRPPVSIQGLLMPTGRFKY
jgi:hypothetical protein